jgi:hypothetical protein
MIGKRIWEFMNKDLAEPDGHQHIQAIENKPAADQLPGNPT